jgi:hypothetical protein
MVFACRSPGLMSARLAGMPLRKKVERIVSREDGQVSLIRGLDEASNPLDIG